MTIRRVVLTVVVAMLLPGRTPAQSPQGEHAGRDKPPEAEADAQVADGQPAGSQRLRISVALMAGYGHDGANAPLGFEKQGRVGYAIVTMEGRPNRWFSYRLAMNPVDETEPLPACGEPDYFYPNEPGVLWTAGPRVPCHPGSGNRRVDAYRGIALDVVSQQGPIREAWLELGLADASVRFGRTLLPIGFSGEEAGYLTAKDATRIQRINTEANFGLVLTYAKRRTGRAKPVVSANVAAFLGDGNRWHDYNYFYFEDGSLDTNSGLTALASGSVSPGDWLELRAAYKRGYTGSKVERLPSYWASKRNDDAVVAGAEYRPVRHARVVGEWARYVWGPTATSAAMLGMEQSPIVRRGYWVTGEAWHPLARSLTLGGSVTGERIDRADSLVRYLAGAGLYGVVEGRSDRLLVFRFHADLSPGVRIGFYRTRESNPYPWLSGIWPVAGPRAFSGRPTDKWGVVVRMHLE